MIREITAGKITGKYQLHYSYDLKAPNTITNIDVKADQIVHDDLRIAFRQLVPHMVFACEMIGKSKELEKAIENMEEVTDKSGTGKELLKYRVTQFSIKGEGEEKAIVLTGNKLLSTGRQMNFSAPSIAFDDDKYEYLNELLEALQTCQEEVDAYLEGKFAPNAQGDLFDGDATTKVAGQPGDTNDPEWTDFEKQKALEASAKNKSNTVPKDKAPKAAAEKKK